MDHRIVEHADWRWTAGSPRVLMVGYNGANNTGAEALLLSDIEDVRAVLGPDVRITVPTLNEKNLRRYIREDSNLAIAPIPTLYFGALQKLVSEHDLVMLVEGSTYMDTWGSALLWAFLWSTWCAASMGKRCLAYAVDAGSLSPFNQGLVRRVASRTDLIVTRNRAAAERLVSYGVTAPMESTADNAFTFQPLPEDEGWPFREWPEASRGMVGMAVVDFSLWPVVMRPWGRKKDCYKWPYYFSRSRKRLEAGEALARGFAEAADRVVRKHRKSVALICMEQVDEPLAHAIRARMEDPGMARVFSSRQHNASRMTVLLRSLDLLVTSRFHAAVLSLAAQVPQVAVGHDVRLRTLYEDLELRQRFFLDPRSPDLFGLLDERIETLLTDPSRVDATLRKGWAAHLTRARRNRELLASAIRSFGMGDAFEGAA